MSQPVCAIIDAGEGFDISLISRSETGSRAAAWANDGAKVRCFAADAV